MKDFCISNIPFIVFAVVVVKKFVVDDDVVDWDVKNDVVESSSVDVVWSFVVVVVMRFPLEISSVVDVDVVEGSSVVDEDFSCCVVVTSSPLERSSVVVDSSSVVDVVEGSSVVDVDEIDNIVETFSLETCWVDVETFSFDVEVIKSVEVVVMVVEIGATIVRVVVAVVVDCWVDVTGCSVVEVFAGNIIMGGCCFVVVVGMLVDVIGPAEVNSRMIFLGVDGSVVWVEGWKFDWDEFVQVDSVNWLLFV